MISYSSVIFIILLLFTNSGVLTAVVAASSHQQCTRGYHSKERIQEWGVQSKQSIGAHPHQQLFHSLRFTCSGSLTRWFLKAKTEYPNPEDTATYPELQIWRRISADAYRKVGSSRIDVDPINRQTRVYTFAPNPPLRFQSGDIFGLWEGRNNDRNTREVDNIYQNLTNGFNYRATNGPMTEITTGSPYQFPLGTPLVAVETEPPGCDTFISLDRLSTHSTRLPCCDTGYYLHIIPNMTFTCNGNITGWTAGALWSHSRNPRIIPELQVWRNELDSGGTFSRVASVQLNINPEAEPTTPTNIIGNYVSKQVFSNNFDVPISVRKGDVLGLVQSTEGQMAVVMTSFPYISLPRNYILTSTENSFSNLRNVDLLLSRWNLIEMLQPLIALDISAESESLLPMTTEPQPTTTTPPNVTTLPDPSPLTSQTPPTSSPDLHPSATTIQPQSSPVTEMADRTTTDTTPTGGLLESKHIFGIIVGSLLLVVLIIIGVVLTGFLLILAARRHNNRHQFVETFIETTDNDAYTIRRKLPYTRSHNAAGHTAQNGLHMALIPHPTDDNMIATKKNLAYSTSSEASKIWSCMHQQEGDIPVSTFVGTQNGRLNPNSRSNDSTIATERNISYTTSSDALATQHRQAKSGENPITGLPHNGGCDLLINRAPNPPTADKIATERNIAYSTNSETLVARSHPPVYATITSTSGRSSPVVGSDKGDENHRATEMKDREASLTKGSTVLVQSGGGLPDGAELEKSVVTTKKVSSSLLDKGSGNGVGVGQGNSSRGQSSHRELPVKPYEMIKLPSVESVKSSSSNC